MAGNGVQVGADDAVRVKAGPDGDGVVIAGDGDACCCAGNPPECIAKFTARYHKAVGDCGWTVDEEATAVCMSWDDIPALPVLEQTTWGVWLDAGDGVAYMYISLGFCGGAMTCQELLEAFVQQNGLPPAPTVHIPYAVCVRYTFDVAFANKLHDDPYAEYEPAQGGGALDEIVVLDACLFEPGQTVTIYDAAACVTIFMTWGATPEANTFVGRLGVGPLCEPYEEKTLPNTWDFYAENIYGYDWHATGSISASIVDCNTEI